MSHIATVAFSLARSNTVIQTKKILETEFRFICTTETQSHIQCYAVPCSSLHPRMSLGWGRYFWQGTLEYMDLSWYPDINSLKHINYVHAMFTAELVQSQCTLLHVYNYLSHVVNKVDAWLNGDAHSLLQYTRCSQTLQPRLLDALHSLRYRNNIQFTILEILQGLAIAILTNTKEYTSFRKNNHIRKISQECRWQQSTLQADKAQWRQTET